MTGGAGEIVGTTGDGSGLAEVVGTGPGDGTPCAAAGTDLAAEPATATATAKMATNADDLVVMVRSFPHRGS